jgi:hypothetical protein
MKRCVIALACVALTNLAAAQNTATGRITGRVVATDGIRLPGVTVVVTAGTTAGTVRRSAITDDNGSFVLLDLPTAVYTLTAYLPGFDLYTREDVAITAPGTLDVDATLRLRCLEEIVIVDQGVASALAEAELVAHVRVVAVSRTQIDLGANCFNAQEYVADVLDIAKGTSVAPTTRISFWKAGSGRAPDNEFVVFLKRGPTGSLTQQASIVNFIYIFPVRDGRVNWPRKDLAGVADGVAVADLLAALRTR